jgi:hypothetical protein
VTLQLGGGKHHDWTTLLGLYIQSWFVGFFWGSESHLARRLVAFSPSSVRVKVWKRTTAQTATLEVKKVRRTNKRAHATPLELSLPPLPI